MISASRLQKIAGFAVIAGFALCGLAEAAETIGFVAAVKGRVEATGEDGKTRPLALKSPIFLKDVIKTGKRGRLQMVFTDQTTINLGRDAEANISEYKYDAAAKNAKMTTNVKEGVFRVMGGKIADLSPDKFKTKTPTATIGIRGCLYVGKQGPGGLLVAFQGGKKGPGGQFLGITVGNGSGSTNLNQQMSATKVAGPNTPPSPPFNMSPEEMGELEGDMGMGGNGDAPGEGDDDAGDDTAEGGDEGAEGDDDTAAGDDDDAAGDDGEVAEGDGDTGTGDEAPADDGGDDDGGGDEMALDSFGDDSTGGDDGTTGGVAPGETDPTDAVGDTVADATTDSSQSDLNQAADDNAITLSDGWSGSMLAYLRVFDAGSSAYDNWWLCAFSDLSAKNDNGHVIGTAYPRDFQNSLAKLFNIDFNATRYLPIGSYTGYTEVDYSSGRLVDLALANGTNAYNFTDVELYYDNLAEFFTWEVGDKTISDGQNTYMYAEVGFAGKPTEIGLMPTTGIRLYDGVEHLAEKVGSEYENALIDSTAVVNFQNNRFIVFSDDDDTNDDVFMVSWGTVQDNKIANYHSYGYSHHTPSNSDRWYSGDAGSGSFYGREAQGFGLMGTGYMKNISGGTTGSYAQVSAGYYNTIENRPSPTGSKTYYGFVAGVSERMSGTAAPDRRYIMNNSGDPTDSFNDALSLNLNFDSGTISGNLSFCQIDEDVYSATTISTQTPLAVGGASIANGAVINEECFVARIYSPGNNQLTVDAYTGGLNPQSGILNTEDPKKQFAGSEYYKWGWWEVSYRDPSTMVNEEYVADGYFVAGELTPQAAIDSLRSANFVGTYNGGAAATMFAGSSRTQLTGGESHLIIDFGASKIENGSYIRFPGVVQLDIDKASSVVSTTKNRFTGGFSGDNVGTLNGAFFGPNAEAAAGNFKVTDASSNKYVGIFGGKR